jgi:AraC-like DNA-binding protein
LHVRDEVTMAAPQPDAKAILLPEAGAQRFVVSWTPPRPELAALVGRHWSVRWDVGDTPYEQAVLAHPTVHVVSELHDVGAPAPAHVPAVHGVVRGTFRRELRTTGRVHGIAFRPGTFRCLLGRDVAAITDLVLPSADVLGPAWVELSRQAIEVDDDVEAAALFDAELLRRGAEPERAALEVADLVERTQADRSLTRSDQLARLAGVSERTLQRTFARHVGVGPKWVVRTYRLQEAAAALTDPGTDLADLAAALGYGDQAHFSNDFRRATGQPPGRYAAARATDATAPGTAPA